VEGRERFLAAAGLPEHAVTTMLAEVYDGEHALRVKVAPCGTITSSRAGSSSTEPRSSLS
jgi:hypothetical protein